MKHLPKENMRALLFLSPTNPLFHMICELEGRPALINDKKIWSITGTTPANRDNWRKGKVLREQTFNNLIKNTGIAIDEAEKHVNAIKKSKDKTAKTAAELRDRLQRFAQAVKHGAHIYTIASTLGMSVTQCQQVLDEIFYKDFPLFPWLHYLSPNKSLVQIDLADQHLEQYEGVYWVYVRRGAKYFKAVLRVRYLLDSGKGRFLRCKMNFPMQEQPTKVGDEYYWQYDGSMAVRDAGARVFWIFEKRRPPRHDYFFFITGAAESQAGHGKYLSGQYLTTGQDPLQSVVTDRVLMERLVIDGDNLQQDYRSYMRQTAILSHKSEIEEIEKKWDAHGAKIFPASD